MTYKLEIDISDELEEACDSALNAVEEAISDIQRNGPPAESKTIEVDIHELLAQRKEIAVIWSIEDVKGVRTDLSDDEAWQVLQQVQDIHDAEWGINWTTLETVADDLFPKPDDADTETTGEHDQAAESTLAAARCHEMQSTMTTSVTRISKDEFDASYQLRKNHLNPDSGWAFGDGGCLFETYGEALDFVRQQEPRTVWTLVDGDDGDQCLLSGFHVVNRIGYLVSTVPFPEGADIEVRIPAPAEPAPASAKPLPAPTRFNVHIYREMRLKFERIEAPTSDEAAGKACELPTEVATEIEDCEGEDFCALVDVIGDENYSQSRIIDFDGERDRKHATVMRVALGRLTTAADNLTAAIDGATDQFVHESAQLRSALRIARDVLAGTRHPDAAATKAALVPLRGDLANLEAILSKKGMVAFVWSVADVKDVRPDLTDEQAYDVLTYAWQQHDPLIGISWDTIKLMAEELFPKSDHFNATHNQ
jgi:hypothetical protein